MEVSVTRPNRELTIVFAALFISLVSFEIPTSSSNVNLSKTSPQVDYWGQVCSRWGTENRNVWNFASFS